MEESVSLPAIRVPPGSHAASVSLKKKRNVLFASKSSTNTHLPDITPQKHKTKKKRKAEKSKRPSEGDSQSHARTTPRSPCSSTSPLKVSIKKVSTAKLRTKRMSKSRIADLSSLCIRDHLHTNSKEDSNRDLVKFWLGCIMLMSRSRFFHIMSKPNPYNSPQAIALMRQKVVMSKRILKVLREQSSWFLRRIARRVIILRKHGWRLLLFWRCYKRKKAAILIRQLFQDFYLFRLPYIMLRYRANAVHLQRYVRAFVVTTKVRVMALSMRWKQIEDDMRANLIPRLLDQRHREVVQQKLLQASEENMKWKRVKLDGAIFPQLAERVNRATYATVKLNQCINDSEKRISGYQRKVMQSDIFNPEVEDMRRQRMQDRLNKQTAHRRAIDRTSRGPSRKVKAKKASKYDPVDLGLKPSPPLSQRAKEKIIYHFLFEARRLYKEIEMERKIIREKKKLVGLSVEEVKDMLSSKRAVDKFAELLCAQDLKSKSTTMLVYTGQTAENFRSLVEFHLKKEIGFI
mmetsp:Transcript_1731/g.2712  ORF Transcript_1731/g.2712 Transcript_1731/m.2712 type:complete len:517 (+) Transcript_1731:66-1616(+)